jgi:hypothetical protein
VDLILIRILEFLKNILKDAPHTGHLKEIIEVIKFRSIKEHLQRSYSSQESAEVLVYKNNISYSRALRILYKKYLRSVKPTRKPGLNI